MVSLEGVPPGGPASLLGDAWAVVCPALSPAHLLSLPAYQSLWAAITLESELELALTVAQDVGNPAQIRETLAAAARHGLVQGSA
jgi:hypothetical protein